MKGKSLLASACVISLACGYIAGKIGRTSSTETTAAPSHQSRPDRPSSRETRARSTSDSAFLDSILAGRAIGEISPTDLAALIAKLSKYDPVMDPLTRAKQQYQLQLLLAKLYPENLAEIASASQSDPEAKKSNSIHSVLAAFAGKDPDRALEWLSTQENNTALHSIVLSVIARHDPHTAADLLRKAIHEGNISSNQLWSATHGIGQAMARLGTVPLLTYLDSLPRQQQSNIISNSFQHIPEGEHIKFLDEIQRRNKDGKLPGFSINSLFSSLLSTDQAAATEWLSKQPDSPEKNSLRINSANELFQRGEKEAAATWMREALAASPGKEKETLGNVIQNLIHFTPEGIAYFARLLPEETEFIAKDLEPYAQNALYNGNTGGLTALASVIPDPAEKARFIASTLGKISPTSGLGNRFNANDFDILSRQISAMEFSGENATLVNDALAAARSPANP